MREGEWLSTTQASLNCSLPIFRGEWTGESVQGGRCQQPLGGEDQAEDFAQGCPGGWYRCRFSESFKAYRRREGYPNPRIHKDTPSLILDALTFYEQAEAKAERIFNESLA